MCTCKQRKVSGRHRRSDTLRCTARKPARGIAAAYCMLMAYAYLSLTAVTDSHCLLLPCRSLPYRDSSRQKGDGRLCCRPRRCHQDTAAAWSVLLARPWPILLQQSLAEMTMMACQRMA